jgi:hypothetical protein
MLDDGLSTHLSMIYFGGVWKILTNTPYGSPKPIIEGLKTIDTAGASFIAKREKLAQFLIEDYINRAVESRAVRLMVFFRYKCT